MFVVDDFIGVTGHHWCLHRIRSFVADSTIIMVVRAVIVVVIFEAMIYSYVL